MGSTILQVTKVLAHVAVPLVAFAVGLASASASVTWLWRELWLLARSLLATLVLVPILTIVMVLGAKLPPEVRGGLVIASLSIGPVAALRKSAKAGGNLSYAIGLNLLMLAISVVYVPAAVAILARVFRRDLHLSPIDVLKPVLAVQLLPLVAGLGLARLAPRFADRIGRPVAVAGNILFGAVVVLVLVMTWRHVLGIGVVGLIATSTVAAMAIIIGHTLGGPQPETRRVLASFCTLKFPLLAILIATASPNGKRVLPVVVAYLLLSAVVLAVYGAVGKAARGGRTASQRPASAGVG